MSINNFLKSLVALMIGGLQIAIWWNWEVDMAFSLNEFPELGEILNRAGLPLLTAFMVFLIPNRMPKL